MVDPERGLVAVEMFHAFGNHSHGGQVSVHCLLKRPTVLGRRTGGRAITGDSGGQRYVKVGSCSGLLDRRANTGPKRAKTADV